MIRGAMASISPMMWYNGAASAATHSPLGRRPHWPSSTRARGKGKALRTEGRPWENRCSSCVKHQRRPLAALPLKGRSSEGRPLFSSSLKWEMCFPAGRLPQDTRQPPGHKALPPAHQVQHIGDDHSLKRRFTENLVHIVEIAVHTKDGFRTGIIDEIAQILRRVNRGDRHHDRAQSIEASQAMMV